MMKKNIIDEIIKGKPLSHSNELFEWVQQSNDNQNEYIRYKNLWALLQGGSEMDQKFIKEDFKLIKKQLGRPRYKFNLVSLIKYAAVFIIAIISGYFIHTISLNQDVAINEILVPNGNRSLVVLPDGSEVWLTNGSKIIYPESFSGKTRKVKLEGEAYFKISHKKRKSFIVDLGDQRIKVLGTEFSVVAYPGDDLVQVDLVAGKVQLDVFSDKDNNEYKSYVLKPNHSLVLDKTSGSLNIAKTPDGFYKYWQEGIYEFKNESFAGLAKKIERIYSVNIIFENKTLSEKKFTGAFFIDSNIYTIIETFKRASDTPFNYTIDKNRIYISNIN
jgi:ferric-dicitrate binding protein FerR (iron transport regulator)